ncbi:alpha-(1,3)-fucosyltransferase C-like [Macrobrachium nipponense]|uniref:alpha-(1,3)-fucosyltransferase C-like n=1 Tax=Macrobrachium nipponense TaxID=159736 RepID=UPI0030C84422
MSKAKKFFVFLFVCIVCGLTLHLLPRINHNILTQPSSHFAGPLLNASFPDTVPGPSALFRDETFAPVMELFRKKAMGKLVPQLTRFRSGSVPRALLWSRPFMGKGYWDAAFSQVRKEECPLPCEIVYDVKEKNTTDAILIFLRGAKDSQTVTAGLSPRDPRQPWVMLNFESPALANSVHGTRYEKYDGLFNRTMFYRRDSDVVFSHGFVISKEDAHFLPRSWVIPPLTEAANYARKLAVAFISNCRAASRRLQYVRRVQKYAQVDVYGRCGNLSCSGSMYVEHMYNTTTDPCLKVAGEGYLFYFAFENNFCSEYVTEKVYNLMHYPIVPVVLGSANYSSVLPPNSYINANEYSPKELAERLLYLKDNPQEYEQYFEWKKYYQPSTVGGVRIMCDLCSRLHDPEFYEHKVYEDFHDWFVGKSRCMAGMELRR